MVSSVNSSSNLSVHQMLTRLDQNDDGTVNEKELVAQRSENVSARQAEDIFRNVDWNRDGQMSEGELSATFQLISSQTLNALIENQSVTKTVMSNYSKNLTSDPEGTFSDLDQDKNGQLTEGEFQLGRESISSSKASTLWNQILGNSYSADGATTMNKQQFATGVNNTLDQAKAAEVENTRSQILNTIQDIALSSINLGTDNASDFFAKIDNDRDGYVTKNDFLAGMPTSVTATQANAMWSRIVSSSGTDNPSGALSENQFAAGFYSIKTNDITTSSSLDEDTINEMMAFIQTYGSSDSSVSGDPLTSSLTLDDPESTFTALDSDNDGMVSEDNFMNGMSSLSSAQANSLWNAIVAHSGAADGATALNREQFVTGYLDREVPLNTTQDNTAQLSDLLSSLRDSIPRMYDLGTSNKSDMFAKLDTDSDGTINKQDFLSARPSTVSAAQATVTWDTIVAKSGTPQATSLAENEFITGLDNLWGSSLSEDDAKQLTSLLYTLDGTTTTVLKANNNLSDLFSSIDTDSDGLISRADLVDARRSTASEDRANVLWQQIVLNAGLDESDSQITEGQFVEGYSAIDISNLADDVADRLNSYLTALQANPPVISTEEDTSDVTDTTNDGSVTFDLSAYNPSDLFSVADQNGDGYIKKEDFVSSLSISADDAAVLWSHIAGNSGNSDADPTLSESQFVTGYNLTDPATMSSPDEYATAKQLADFVETLRSAPLASFDMRSVDAGTLFSEMDGDQDELVMRDDFINSRPTELSKDDASQLWDMIASNSGTANNGEILSRDQFMTGYGSVGEVNISVVDKGVLDRLDSAVEDIGNRRFGILSMKIVNSEGTKNQADVNLDKSVSLSEALSALSDEVGTADSAFPASDRSQYIVQQLASMMKAYGQA